MYHTLLVAVLDRLTMFRKRKWLSKAKCKSRNLNALRFFENF